MKLKISSLLLLGTLVLNSINIQAINTNQMMTDRYNIACDADKEVVYDLDVEISFYTSLLCENTSYGAVNAIGKPLEYGCIAIPREYELGTQFEFEGIDGIFTGNDRGSKKHIRIRDDGVIRIDMFVPKNNGESNSDYFKRVNSYGKHKTKAKIVVDK